MHVAICVATFCRPEGLGRLLDALARLQMPDLPDLELALVVVDNSEDASAERQVSRAVATMPMPLHYVAEPHRGITYARNAALEKATALGCDFVAFIDDDEMPAPQWLAALLAAQRQSGAAAVLGAVAPVFPAGTPKWLIAGRFFETHVFADGAEIDDAHTANVLIDLNRIRSLGLSFDHRFALTGGEDTMLFRDLREVGGNIVFAAEAVVYETVPESRTNLGWLLRRWYRTGNVEAALYLRGRRHALWRRMVNILRGLLRVAAGGGLFVASLLVLGFGRKHRIVRPLYTLCRGCGIVASTLGCNYREYREVHGT